MLTTRKHKGRFKVRIFDLDTRKNTSFIVYEDDGKMTLTKFKTMLQKRSETRSK